MLFLLLSPPSPPHWYSCILFFFQELPFKVVQHIITTVDCQPSRDNGVLVFVVGQLKVLNSYVCTAPLIFGGCKDTWLVSGVDPGFFLGRGALVSCSTSTPINHIVFFFFGRIPVVLENCRSSRGGAHPLHPPPRSAPKPCLVLYMVLEIWSVGQCLPILIRIHRSHEKPGKSWNLAISFSRPG